jgi:hypothetical protein
MEILHKSRLDLDQFRTAIRADAFQPITLRAGGAYFSIEGRIRVPPRPKPRTREEREAASEREVEACMILCTSRTKTPRRFRNPSAALQVLREIGATRVEVEIGNWYPDRAKRYADVKRPDMAVRLKRAHEAARVEAQARWKPASFEE